MQKTAFVVAKTTFENGLNKPKTQYFHHTTAYKQIAL